MYRTLTLLACLIATPATAQDWAMRDGDEVLTETALADRLVGQEITFYDNGVSSFARDGEYSYTYFQGGTAYGAFQIVEDGKICINFRNGFSRCDLYVNNAGRLVLLTEDGYRFPVRPSE